MHLRLAVEVFKWLKITIAIFTLDEKQIIWMDKLSQMDKSPDVKMGQRNFQTSKGTSRPKSDLNSDSDLEEQMVDLPILGEWN